MDSKDENVASRRRLPRGLREERFFRWRGGDVSRIEALSDAVFAFSLTLLVVALEVPQSSDQLVAVFWQFPAFALCFVFLLWVWFEHYLYYRRFGFEDAVTVGLNGLLLFFVVFYVYPLKFLASALITDDLLNQGNVTFGTHGRTVMWLYSGGFVGIFSVFSLLYARAWWLREELELDEAERVVTRGALTGHLASVVIGLASIALAFVIPVLSGLIYFAMGPVQGWNGFRTGRKLKGVATDPGA
ncbi:MAG: DUF1211 domain-containing protein [Thermoanaerobaculia bacterium]|nr:DUF1211 domain-containing protein [Thermoanaerobaculia bacterium]